MEDLRPFCEVPNCGKRAVVVLRDGIDHGEPLHELLEEHKFCEDHKRMLSTKKFSWQTWHSVYFRKLKDIE